jgi:hypothetical protein
MAAASVITLIAGAATPSVTREKEDHLQVGLLRELLKRAVERLTVDAERERRRRMPPSLHKTVLRQQHPAARATGDDPTPPCGSHEHFHHLMHVVVR